MNRRMVLQLGGLGAAALAQQACFGSFKITRLIWGFNKDISNSKIVQWLVFLVIALVPVYGVGVLIDVIIMNSLEFWGLGSPSATAPSEPEMERRVALGQGAWLNLTRMPDGAVEMQIERPHDTTISLQFAPEAEGVSARDDRGQEIARVQEGDEGSLVIQGKNLPSQVVSAQERELLARHWEAGGAQGTLAYVQGGVHVAGR